MWKEIKWTLLKVSGLSIPVPREQIFKIWDDARGTDIFHFEIGGVKID